MFIHPTVVRSASCRLMRLLAAHVGRASFAGSPAPAPPAHGRSVFREACQFSTMLATSGHRSSRFILLPPRLHHDLLARLPRPAKPVLLRLESEALQPHAHARARGRAAGERVHLRLGRSVAYSARPPPRSANNLTDSPDTPLSATRLQNFLSAVMNSKSSSSAKAR